MSDFHTAVTQALREDASYGVFNSYSGRDLALVCRLNSNDREAAMAQFHEMVIEEGPDMIVDRLAYMSMYFWKSFWFVVEYKMMPWVDDLNAVMERAEVLKVTQEANEIANNKETSNYFDRIFEDDIDADENTLDELWDITLKHNGRPI